MSKSVVEKLRKFLSKELREQVEKEDKLRKIIAKIQKKQNKLEHELAESGDAEQKAELEKKIRFLKKQRDKGMSHLETLQRNNS